MRALRTILLLLVLVVAGLGLGAYLLPRNVVVERSASIAAPPSDVFPLVNSLRRAAEWSPWFGRDPEMEVAFSGPDEGVGATMAWSLDDPAVGSGRQEIVESVPGERVVSALDFGGMGTARAWFDLVPEGSGTRVTWGLDSDMGMSPVGRWMGVMMDRWVGADYERGLENIRRIAEGG